MSEDELWELFAASSLPGPDWTHGAHLRIAWMHLQQYDLDASHILMRVGIIKLNRFHQLVETPVRGYHESITRGWLLLVRSASRRFPSERSDVFMLAAGGELGTSALLGYYSKELLMSAAARARFIEPDLKQLPS
jgi:hypothetical protein